MKTLTYGPLFAILGGLAHRLSYATRATVVVFMNESGTELVARKSQKTGGLASALWIIAKPGPKVAIAPSEKAVRYSDARRRGIAPRCDIYRPIGSGEGPTPSVLLVHGGAFVIGNRRMKPIRYVATRLAQAGIGVCSIDYRMLFRGGGIVEALEDVNSAASYWRSHASDFGCSPQMISMMGLSAGSALMLLHAAQSEHSYQCLVNAYGPTDFTSVRGRRAELVMRLIQKSRDREVWKSRSPLYSKPIAAPILHLHGKLDQMVPVEHALRFHQSRTEQGLPSELALYDEAPHGWLCDPTRDESEPSIQRAHEFVHAHSAGR